jgi:hypothetical protein
MMTKKEIFMKKSIVKIISVISVSMILLLTGCPAVNGGLSENTKDTDKKCESPSFSLNTGTYFNTIAVNIATMTNGATIRYTIDGTDPTPKSGKIYTGSIMISKEITLKAISYKTGWIDSIVTSVKYTFSSGTQIGTDIPETGASAEEFILPGYRDTSGNMTVKDSGYAVSGHWTLDGSPYRVNGNLFVKKGTKLVIDPGVKIIFKGRYWLRLMGGMIAKGTASAMIVFTTTDGDIALGDGWVGWGGIRICGDDYDETVIDTGNGSAIWDFEFCEIAYVDKNNGVSGHPWERIDGSFYTHGASNTDLVFNDNWIHHSRSGLFAYYGASDSTLFAEPVFYRNIFEKGSISPSIIVCHVYTAQILHGPSTMLGTSPSTMLGTGPGMTNYFATRFIGGAVRDYLVGTQSPYSTVAYCWDTPIILDAVEITNCGDRDTSPWFDAANPNGPPNYDTWASITYTAP